MLIFSIHIFILSLNTLAMFANIKLFERKSSLAYIYVYGNEIIVSQVKNILRTKRRIFQYIY